MCDPVYPVYVDSNVMAGRTGTYDPETEMWSDVIYMPCTMENNFVPEFPKETPDIIYLCLPNNPTGTTITKDQLQGWVDYANKNKAVIIYDAAYEAYISEENVAHSIYECEGAKTCAIELKSLDVYKRQTFLVRCVVKLIMFGVTSEYCGTKSTSSKVIPSPIIVPIFIFLAFLV